MFFFYRREKVIERNLNKAFAGREKLNDVDFYERYFKSKGVPFFIVQKIREILAEEFKADLSRLSAEDDFSKELSFFWELDSMSDVEIILRIEQEFQIKLTAEDMPDHFRTVGGIVDLVWSKVREK